MIVRGLDNVSGVDRDNHSYQLLVNEVKDLDDYVANDLVKHGLAESVNGQAIAPMITRNKVMHAVVKRRKRNV